MGVTGIGTFSWLEMLWLVSGLGGALVYWFLVLNASSDRVFAKDEARKAQERGDAESIESGEIRTIVADMSFWTEVTIFSTMVGFALIGIVAGAQAPANPSRVYSPAAITITVVFLSTSIALNVNGVRRRWWRNRLYEIEARREARRRRGEHWSGEERRTP